MEIIGVESQQVTFHDFREQVLADYKLGRISREMSLLGRREVLTGKAKFGIFGDGKELPQLAMARVFRNGDFRSGYYRDQTFAMAIGALTIKSFFASLYADTDIERDPSSAGRQMDCHFATRSLNEDGTWKDLTKIKNISSDISTTAGQMPRLLGLGLASKYYEKNQFPGSEKFSNQGIEVAFGTIGDASTAEGHFWELLNAACALQIPMILSIWDDGYGISVVSERERAKKSMPELLSGFQRRDGKKEGCEVIEVKGWDYAALQDAYQRAEHLARVERVPVVLHVNEVTQPSGHSTSGSHERYKSPERLQWETDHDGLKKFREWILSYSLEVDGQTIRLATEEEMTSLDLEAKKLVRSEQKKAWADYQGAIKNIENQVIPAVKSLLQVSENSDGLQKELQKFKSLINIGKKEVFHLIRRSLWVTRGESSPERSYLESVLQNITKEEELNYSSQLYSESEWRGTNIPEVKPEYADDAPLVDGRIVIRDNFDKLFDRYPELMVFGEDSGKIGDVNQGLEGLQLKYGADRVADTGIREATIIGQGIGLAMRGLRPIAEIQYLDYLLYGLQIMSDDLATLHYRTRGGQKAPLIVRTRGHRLEGIWHSGSPMAGILNLCKGVYILVPRDLTRAAGFYNTMLQSDNPCLIVEPLNGYRLKEKLPSNIGSFTTPVGIAEKTRDGSDVTVVTYGSTWRIVMESAEELKELGIEIDVIDIQSLIPLDLNQIIGESVKKTGRLVVVDEDVPGGASAYIVQQVIEKQGVFTHLDCAPVTITGKEHRPAYASDGDYFSKPSADEIVEKIYNIMYESNPKKFPKI